jgi:hypothetical protein
MIQKCSKLWVIYHLQCLVNYENYEMCSMVIYYKCDQSVKDMLDS